MNENLKQKIIEKAKQLKNVYDCFDIEISKDKTLFIQVEYKEKFNSKEKEYFVELNDVYYIDNDKCCEPCGKYNERVMFGNLELLVSTIDKYLKYHKINV